MSNTIYKIYFERSQNRSLDSIPLNHVEFELPVVEQAVDPFVDQFVALHAALNHHLMGGEKKVKQGRESCERQKEMRWRSDDIRSYAYEVLLSF